MASAGVPAIDPLLEIVLILSILVELSGGTAILLGWRTRPAAVVVILFTGLVTMVFHRFWDAPPEEAMVQQLMFMKNVAIMGGLLLLAAVGPGEYALDDDPGTQRGESPWGTSGALPATKAADDL